MLNVEKDSTQFISWCRYLYWSDLQGKRVFNFKEDIPIENDWEFFAKISLWAASAYVVIEGWIKLKYQDEIINELINDWPENITKLRRFRNTVYHYSPKLFDRKLTDLSNSRNDTFFWIFCLHYEFKRYLWEYPKTIMVYQNQIDEFRDNLLKSIGWDNFETTYSKYDEIKVLCRNTIKMLKKEDDITSPEAIELLRVINDNIITLKSISLNPLLEIVRKSKSK